MEDNKHCSIKSIYLYFITSELKYYRALYEKLQRDEESEEKKNRGS